MNPTKSTLKPLDPLARTSGAWAKKSNERVLVIADDEATRAELVKLLSSEGFVVFDQPSAIGATRAIRDHNIRSVVVEVGGPGMRGEKLVSVLRENPRLDGLVIVVIAANDGSEPSQKGLETADAILSDRDVEFRLTPLLARLLRGSSFSPQSAFASASVKP
ncbi:MAG TPA: response regulator [Polyangiaceae bacterium]